MFSFRATTGSEKCIIEKIYKYINEKNQISESSKKLMYYSYISGKYKKDANKTAAEKYFEDIKTTFGNTIQSQCPSCQNLQEQQNIPFNSPEGQMASQIVDLSSVAYRKFSLFNFALKCEIIIFGLGGIGAILMMIIKSIGHIIH